MDSGILFVFALIVLSMVLAASGRVRLDVVAAVIMISLNLGGILTPQEAFAGFGNPVVVLVAALLILGDMLTRTGVAQALGQWLCRVAAGSEIRLLIMLMLTAAFMGSVMSSTAVVAVLIPATLYISNKTGIGRARLMLPLSYAALMSGMLTLIGTPPNFIVSAELESSGYGELGFLSFTPVGLVVLTVGIGYMLLIGRRLLPADHRTAVAAGSGLRLSELLDEYKVFELGHLFRIPKDSPLVGCEIRDSLIESHGVRVMILQRYEGFGIRVQPNPAGHERLRAGDILLTLPDTLEAGNAMAAAAQLYRRTITADLRERWAREVGLAAVLIHPDSRIIGKSIAQVELRSNYGLQVLAIRRKGELLEDVVNSRLEPGDSMLVMGSWDNIGHLQRARSDFVVLATPVEIEGYMPEQRKAPIAAAILLLMVLVSIFNVMPVVMVVLLAVGAGVVTRCITMDQAYKAIPWTNVVMIAGMLPVAVAMQKTGGVDLIVERLVEGMGLHGPYLVMTALFALTVLLGLFLSNVATAVLLAPIAIRAAELTGVEPHAFAMTVAIAASAAFVTPYSTPVVNLVVEPGGYRFIDFMKLGLPLLLLTWVTTMAVLPMVFPF